MIKFMSRLRELKNYLMSLGRGFFDGKTPIGRRLNEVEIAPLIPPYYLRKGIDEDEWLNFGRNIDTILLAIKKIGLKKFCKGLFEVGLEMI